MPRLTCRRGHQRARIFGEPALRRAKALLLDDDERPDPGTAHRAEGKEKHDQRVPQRPYRAKLQAGHRNAVLTVAQAAAACKVAGPTYIRWEDPYKSNATIKTLEKVAGAFGRQLEVAII